MTPLAPHIEAFLREPLRPAPTTDAWRAIAEATAWQDFAARSRRFGGRSDG